jgi:hypothetical protein
MVKCIMKGMLGFMIFALAVVALLLIFSGKEYPSIPDDDFHRGPRDNAVCVECHGPGKQNALKKNHPPKYECLKCHTPKAKKA